MTDIIETFRKQEIEFEQNYILAKVSSFKVGGSADLALFPKNESEFCFVVSVLSETNTKFEILGRCSNVLFSDDGYRGVIIFTNKMKDITFNDNTVVAMAGAGLATVAVLARDRSLGGFEFAHGIPGSIGGAVAMNAGAFDSEMKDIVVSSIILDLNNEKFSVIDNSEHEFSYRDSIFLRNKNLICISTTIKLFESTHEEISEKMSYFSKIRREKQPLEYPSCGSFFKRPQGLYAAKLIDDCGLKGYSVGGAMVSNKHAGFIINTGRATSKDIVELGDLVSNKIYEKFGVRLEREVKYIF